MHVFVTRSLPIDAAAIAPRGISVDVSRVDRPLSAGEIAEIAANADGLVSMLYDPLDEPLIARLPRLKVIANYAVGVNNIDLAAARARGIRVCNTPGVLTGATAELTMALMLALVRRMREGERLLRSGAFDGWAPGLLLGSGLSGRTLGILGYGRIGQAVARLAHAFGMNVLYTSRSAAPPGAPAADRVDWPQLLATSDVLSLHTPLDSETRHIVDAKALAAMKPGAFLINTARGPLIDEAALVAALESRRIAGAGLDVFEHEPGVHPGLIGRDDVVLLPHVGSATIEARTAMARLALEGCFAVLEGRTPPNLV